MGKRAWRGLRGGASAQFGESLVLGSEAQKGVSGEDEENFLKIFKILKIFEFFFRDRAVVGTYYTRNRAQPDFWEGRPFS